MTSQVQRWLITSADERTWKFDRPVIFLGEWCRLYERKPIWQDMDAIVAVPYGLGQNQKDADHVVARNLEDRLLPVLCDLLNIHHGTQHGQRFWRIALGHWLRRYVDVIFNRVRTLELCLQTYPLSGTTAYADDGYSLVALDSHAAIWAFGDDRWNNALYIRILQLLGNKGCPVELISGDAADGFRFSVLTNSAPPISRRILKLGYHCVHKMLGLLIRENDAFIINSYLPKKIEIKLQLVLGQLPQIWTSPQLIVTKMPDSALRQRLFDRIADNTGDPIFGIMCSLIFELLPVCYLEGFAELSEQVKQLPWPSSPKFILTSNNFDTDEMFKCWSGSKIETGTPYFIGQHGNYGVTRNHIDPSIEEFTSDKFLTWGWVGGLPQHTPAFILKKAGCRAEAYDPNGGLLLIEVCMNHRLTTWDGTFEFAKYFEDQQVFVSKLTSAPREQLTIRLHAAYRYQKWGEVERWHEFDPDIKVDGGGFAIGKLISRSRLIVHSYDSTGILETLAQNIPTLAFWQNDLDHLRESAKPYYQLLVDAGIVHLTSESVAAKVNEVWEDVQGWWTQSAVQEARMIFCDRYARVSASPVSELKQLLLRGSL